MSAPCPFASNSPAADIRSLAQQMKSGALTREQYFEERNRIRAGWSKTKALPAETDPECDGGYARRLEILAELRAACETGDASALRACLRSNPGLDIEVLEDEGALRSPLLHAAAECESCECVIVLLEDGEVAVDSVGEFGTTVLFDACHFDRLNIAMAAQRGGANVEFKDANGRTPLYAAAFRGNLRCMDLMITHKATVYYQCGEEQLTPLHAAVQGGNELCVARLLHAGHPVNARNAEGLTALLDAASFGGSPCGSNGKKGCMLQLLDGGADTNAVDKMGRNAMQLLLMGGIGCKHCTFVCAERLVEKGASVLHRDSGGKNAVEYLDELKTSAPTIHSLLKNAMQRETWRQKLRRADKAPRAVEVDAATLAEQEEKARAAAAALLAEEEADRVSDEKQKKRRRKKKVQERESAGCDDPSEQDPAASTRTPHALSTTNAALPEEVGSETQLLQGEQDSAAVPPLALLDNLQLLRGADEAEGESDSEVAGEIEAFRKRLQDCHCPRPRITLHPAAFRSLSETLRALRLKCDCGGGSHALQASDGEGEHATAGCKGKTDRHDGGTKVACSIPHAKACGGRARAVKARGRRS